MLLARTSSADMNRAHLALTAARMSRLIIQPSLNVAIRPRRGPDHVDGGAERECRVG